MCGWFDEVKARTEELSESLQQLRKYDGPQPSRQPTTARSRRFPFFLPAAVTLGKDLRELCSEQKNLR